MAVAAASAAATANVIGSAGLTPTSSDCSHRPEMYASTMPAPTPTAESDSDRFAIIATNLQQCIVAGDEASLDKEKLEKLFLSLA